MTLQDSALTAVLDSPPPPELLAMNFAFSRARVLGTALEVDLFTSLAERPCDAATLATRLSCDPDAMGRLLAVLVDAGLLERGPGGVLAPTRLAGTHLVAGRPGFLGPHFEDVLDQWDRWGELTRIVRTGKRTGPLGDLAARDRHAGMFGGNFPLAIGMVHRITEALRVPSGARILDHLAGGGEWGISLGTRYPDATVVARDTPELLAGVRRRVAEFGLADRFTFVTVGDEPPYPDGYDVVVLAQVGRFVGAGRLAGLVREAAARLRPHGTFVLADVMAPVPGAGGGPAAMLDLSLFVNTEEGGLIPRLQYEGLLADVGLRLSGTATAGLLTALISER